MKKFKFILIVFRGRGWITPLRDILTKPQFKSIVLDLSDRGIFNLSDVFIQKEKGLLSLKLNHLDLNHQEREELENLLETLLNDLIKYEEMKRKLFKYSVLILFFSFVGLFIFNRIKNDTEFKRQELKSLIISVEKKKNEIRSIEEDLIEINQEIENCIQ